MASISVSVPSSLGLSDDDINALRVQFENHVVDAFQASARPSAEPKVVPEVVHVEVIVL